MTLRTARLGLVPYESALRLQERLHALRADDRIPDTLLLCEHPPTITLGTSAAPEDLPLARTDYARRGIEVAATGRGGRATYHGPGQLVAYPVFRLGPGEIRSWLSILQGVVLEILSSYGVRGERDAAQAGVRVGGAKIAAFGVRIARRVATHGFALNVDPDLSPYALFTPCGVAAERMTTLERERGAAPAWDEVAGRTAEAFARLREGEAEEIGAAPLWCEAFPLDAPPFCALPRPGAPDRVGPKPEWLRRPFPSGAAYARVAASIESNGLHTVCASAQCPNLGECWSAGTATLMLLGDVCTRACGFCAVETGRPGGYDRDEPRRVAEAVRAMGLSYVVLTSVNRDDLADGGSEVWAESIRAVRDLGVQVEVLVPDFLGDAEAWDRVLDAHPSIFNHNLETVPRLYATVRPKARYERSLALLQRAAARGLAAKSGIMLGLGEAPHEIEAVLSDLAAAGVRIATLGQYLRPSPAHLPVDRWVHPSEFERWKRLGESLGIAHIEAGPLVRSSYHADASARAAVR